MSEEIEDTHPPVSPFVSTPPKIPASALRAAPGLRMNVTKAPYERTPAAQLRR